MLAGISPNYYLRLEQGRDRHPSAQVIDALARALQLDAGATAFLHSLAHPEPATRERPQRERVPATIEWLIGSWRTTPAIVHDRHMDILAANRIALALSPALCPGVNAVRAIFMEPAMRPLYEERLGRGRQRRHRTAPPAGRPRRRRSRAGRTRPRPLREQRGLLPPVGPPRHQGDGAQFPDLQPPGRGTHGGVRPGARHRRDGPPGPVHPSHRARQPIRARPAPARRHGRRRRHGD